MQCREDFTSIFTNKDYIINIAMFNDITNVLQIQRYEKSYGLWDTLNVV